MKTPGLRTPLALSTIVVFLLSPFSLLRAAPAVPLPDGLYAEFTTPRGAFTCELFFQKAPLMCANFTGLAEGALPDGRAPKDGKPFYTGLTWYRVVPGFVIQSGNPGLKDTDDEKKPIPHHFPDEFVPGLHHSAAGILSMANAGPDTNSCEFFLTLASTNRLNYLHSVFGRTVRGLEVLAQIKQDDPVAIKIVRIGAAARAFKADAATFAALSAKAKKYTAAREPGAAAHFDDPDKLLPAEPPRARNFNFKLANFERATGVRLVARVFAHDPPAAEDNQPGKFMRALAAKLGTAKDGVLAVHFGADDWRVWIGDNLTARFVGRPTTAADLGEDGALHDAKEKLLAAAQAEGDAAYEQQKKSSPRDRQPPPAQRLKLQTDAVLDGLLQRLESR